MGILGKVLGTLSGGMEEKLSEQLLFNKVIGFRGIKDGVGCSTIVYNTACAITHHYRYSVCVIDTNMLYPSQECYLKSSREIDKDFMDFTGENLSEVAYKVPNDNIYLISMRSRYLADMLSAKECQSTVDKLFEAVKNFFDVILVDLSHEPTWATTIAAMRCNKIYTIVDPCISTLSVMQKSLNSLASAGVPPYKYKNVIVNKNISDINTGLFRTLKSYDLDVIAEIPFSVDIARFGVTGEKLFGAISNRVAVTKFNQAVEAIVNDFMTSNETTRSKERAPGESVENDPAAKEDMFENQRKGMSIKKPAKAKSAPAMQDVPPEYSESAPVAYPEPTNTGSQINLDKEPEAPVQAQVAPSRPSKPLTSKLKPSMRRPSAAPTPPPASGSGSDDEDVDIFNV